jgi:biopolymer transport protein ExbD
MKIASRKAAVADVDMTPMIDIVFQLIAFFMVITNFENQRADERVKLPSNQLAKPAETPRDKELMLNVGFVRDADGNKTTDEIVFYGTGENVPVLQFDKILQRERRMFEGLGTDPAEVTVVIRADAEVRTGLVQELIKMSKESDFTKFALKAKQEEQK